MRTIDVVIFTLKDISDSYIAETFFNKLELLRIQPKVISLTEPIRESYTKDKAIELWTKEEDGCWDFDSERFIGKAGGLLAKNKKNSIIYSVSWWKSEGMKYANWISFSISSSKYKKVMQYILALFKETVNLTDAFYGYIAHSDTVERQHATGSIITRIPGIFWCNYFSRIYVDFFGNEKFDESQWYKIEMNNEKGIFLFLDDKPDGRLLADKTIEESSKEYLGYDSFANRQEEEIKKQDIVKWCNEDPVQYKKVPKLI